MPSIDILSPRKGDSSFSFKSNEMLGPSPKSSPNAKLKVSTRTLKHQHRREKDVRNLIKSLPGMSISIFVSMCIALLASYLLYFVVPVVFSYARTFFQTFVMGFRHRSDFTSVNAPKFSNDAGKRINMTVQEYDELSPMLFSGQHSKNHREEILLHLFSNCSSLSIDFISSSNLSVIQNSQFHLADFEMFSVPIESVSSSLITLPLGYFKISDILNHCPSLLPLIQEPLLYDNLHQEKSYFLHPRDVRLVEPLQVTLTSNNSPSSFSLSFSSFADVPLTWSRSGVSELLVGKKEWVVISPEVIAQLGYLPQTTLSKWKSDWEQKALLFPNLTNGVQTFFQEEGQIFHFPEGVFYASHCLAWRCVEISRTYPEYFSTRNSLLLAGFLNEIDSVQSSSSPWTVTSASNCSLNDSLAVNVATDYLSLTSSLFYSDDENAYILEGPYYYWRLASHQYEFSHNYPMVIKILTSFFGEQPNYKTMELQALAYEQQGEVLLAVKTWHHTILCNPKYPIAYANILRMLLNDSYQSVFQSSQSESYLSSHQLLQQAREMGIQNEVLRLKKQFLGV